MMSLSLSFPPEKWGASRSLLPSATGSWGQQEPRRIPGSPCCTAPGAKQAAGAPSLSPCADQLCFRLFTHLGSALLLKALTAAAKEGPGWANVSRASLAYPDNGTPISLAANEGELTQFSLLGCSA